MTVDRGFPYKLMTPIEKSCREFDGAAASYVDVFTGIDGQAGRLDERRTARPRGVFWLTKRGMRAALMTAGW